MKTKVLLAALAAPAAFAVGDSGPQGTDFEATRVAHTGTVHVAAPPAKAFHLFTAPGERLWAEGWDPLILSSGDGREKGAVFTTAAHGDVTYWVVINHDAERLHARYARVAPDSRAGTVEVFVQSDGQGGAIAEVTYDLTALSEAGNTALASFGATQFEQMMSEWEVAIREADIDWQSTFFQP